MHPALRHFYYSSSRGGYSEEYQAVLDAGIGTAPSTSQQVKQNALVAALKSAGIWDLLDVFYVFATDGDSAFATINWKDPASFRATLTASPTFTADQGFTGNGTTSYLKTGWIPGTHGVNYTQNNSGIVIGINTDLSSTSDHDFGCSNNALADRVVFNSRNSANLAYAMNASTATTAANASSIGNYLIQRRGSADLRTFKNGASVSTATTASTGVPNFELYIGAENNNGVLGNASARQITHCGAGASLQGLESAFNTAWSTYYTSL